MARIIRTLALSGAAATALLGTAGTVHAAAPEQATVAVEAAVDRAAGAPVTLPSGKTVHVCGFDTAAYRTDASHHATVVALAADASPAPGMAGIDSSLRASTNTGTGAVIGTPTNLNQQQVQAASAGSISVVAALGIGLAVFTFVMVKKGRINAWHAVALVMFGVVLAPTTFDPMLQNLGVSAATSLGNVWSGF
ncbi:hypothetical protein [Streptomyces sp. STR69]|uniref:hypothetical protein n=1 Tax=Streptomyces sp. STR69 TaxID=1796942 RepID=UPI0021CA3A75|nr:hypothetical protein [Streptomyces sp. STR69]